MPSPPPSADIDDVPEFKVLCRWVCPKCATPQNPVARRPDRFLFKCFMCAAWNLASPWNISDLDGGWSKDDPDMVAAWDAIPDVRPLTDAERAAWIIGGETALRDMVLGVP